MPELMLLPEKSELIPLPEEMLRPKPDNPGLKEKGDAEIWKTDRNITPIRKYFIQLFILTPG
jgi:hypothetical protein